MERLCIDCKHYVAAERFGKPMRCVALRTQQNPVLGGDVDSIDAGLMRLTLCGWTDPKLFEPKDRTE